MSIPCSSRVPPALRAAVMVAALAPFAASAATLSNGSFEFTGANGPFITSVAGGATSFGWTSTVAGRNIEFVDSRGGYGPAGDQFGFIDLNGVQNAGGIGQNVLGLVSGQQYRVDFLMSGNAGPSGNTAADGRKQLSVLFDGAGLGTYTYTHFVGETWANRQWLAYSATFTYAGAGSLLEFRSLSTTYNEAGPLLDNVSITELGTTVVPLPASSALLLGGLALFGRLASRRRG